MRKLTLHFAGIDTVELFESCFIHPVIGEPRRCIRGKRSGAYRGYSTFQWTKAVQALSLLMVEAAKRVYEPSSHPMLRGGTGSFASSLDYAIDKQTTWLYDMFGWDDRGAGFSRRLFVRSNPGQRIAAPVAISLQLHCLSELEIEIFLNYEKITTLEGYLGLLNKLQENSAGTNRPVAASINPPIVKCNGDRNRANIMAEPDTIQ
jgi:hypothetical protein